MKATDNVACVDRPAEDGPAMSRTAWLNGLGTSGSAPSARGRLDGTGRDGRSGRRIPGAVMVAAGAADQPAPLASAGRRPAPDVAPPIHEAALVGRMRLTNRLRSPARPTNGRHHPAAKECSSAAADATRSTLAGCVVIDLGNVTERPATAPARPQRQRRAAGVCITAVLGLVCVGSPSAVPANAHPIRIALAAHPTTVLVADDQALVAEPDASGTSITAYQAASGRHRWTTKAADQVDAMRAGPPGLLLLSQSTPAGSEITAVSTKTGDSVWRVAGQTVASVTADRLIATDQRGGGAQTVVGLQPATGRVDWTHSASLDTRVLTAAPTSGHPGAAVVVLVDQSGVVTVLNGRTGRQLARASVAAPAGPGLSIQATTVAGLLVVSTPAVNGPGTVLAAYDLPNLHRRWQTSQPDGGLLVQSCATATASLVCLNGGRPLRVVDALTGVLRWTSPDWSWGQPYAGGQLEVFQGDASGIVDLSSGRTVGDLAGWSSILTVAGLLFHTDATNPHRTWYGRPDPKHAGVHPLGYLEDASQTCGGDPRWLACVTDGGYLAVVQSGRGR